MVSEKLSNIFKYVHYQAFYFIFYGGYIPFLLYFPVYLKHIGLNAAQVGVISGVRPIFQSIATPLLVLIGDKLQSRKKMFIISSLVSIAKVLGLFLLLKPSNQLCLVTTKEYENNSQTVIQHSYVIDHKLSKRDLVMQRWPLLAMNQENGINKQEDFSINVSETQLYYPSKASFGHEEKPITVYWEEHDENSDKDGNKLTVNNTPLSADRLQKNITVFNHVKAKPQHTAVKNLTDHSKSEYRIIDDEDEVQHLFYGLLITVLMSDMFDASMFTLVDHSCMGHQEENYASIRLWGTIGWGFMSPLIAVVLHNFPHDLCGKMVDTYHYIFIFAIVFSNISLLLGSHLDLNADFRTVKARKVHGTRSNFHYGMFLIVFAYAGFCNGFLFSFVNWFIDSIGGNAGIMGVATACKCVIDVVLFFLLKKIIDYLGHVPVISVGLVGHIAVFYVFSRITSPWLVVAVEVFHAIFYGFLVSTCSYFLDQSVPAGSNLRLQALLHGIYWGVGSGSGALFSGLHIDYGGLHETFLIFTWMTIAVAFIYLAVELLTFVVDLKVLGDQEKSLVQSSTSSTGSDADVSSEVASSDMETDEDD